MKTKYDFYADPGHGWMKVSLNELQELGLIEKITSYSYMRNNDVFLEEDCDLSLFIKEKQNLGIKIQFKDHVSRRSSKIRNYSHYSPEKALRMLQFLMLK
jgi:hypothetical protein